MRLRAVLVAALALSALSPAAPGHAAFATGLSAEERRAAAAIDAALPQSLRLLEELVEQNSGTLNLPGVRAVGARLEPEFAALGMAVRWSDGAAFGRAGHLIATRPGRRARLRVLLIGHLDTVFEPDSPFQHFVRTSDSTAAGPGVADMKGGDVILLLVLRGLAAAGALDRFDVRVVLDGDEEHPGSPVELARRELVEAARGCDVALCFENGAGEPGQAIVGRRGSSGWLLRTSGRRAHSSQIFRGEVGAGAVFEAARILDEFRDSLAAQPHLTFNPGLVLGGSSVEREAGSDRGMATGKSNVVAETTLVAGDLRALSPAQLEAARAVMSRIVARHLPRTDASIAFSDGYPPLAPVPGNSALLARFDAASRDLGYGPVVATNPDDAGAADIAFVAGLVPMALDGIGLSGDGGHSSREYGRLPMLAKNAKRVAVMLLRLAAEAKPGR